LQCYLFTIAGLIAAWVNAGVIAPIAAHFLVMPLSPVELRPIVGTIKNGFGVYKNDFWEAIKQDRSKRSKRSKRQDRYIQGPVVYFAFFFALLILIFVIAGLLPTSMIILVGFFAFLLIFLSTFLGRTIYVSVIMMEGLQGIAAAIRSEELFDRVEHTVKSIQRLIVYLAMPAILLIIFFTWLVIKLF